MDHVATARQLPEEFLEAPGTPVQKALLLVYRHWTNYPPAEVHALAHALEALLEPLLHARPGSGVPPSLRQECERAVQSWEVQVARGGKYVEAGPHRDGFTQKRRP